MPGWALAGGGAQGRVPPTLGEALQRGGIWVADDDARGLHNAALDEARDERCGHLAATHEAQTADLGRHDSSLRGEECGMVNIFSVIAPAKRNERRECLLADALIK